MKQKQRKFTARTALLSALTVALIASAAIFIGANAAEETVSPTDTARSSVSRSDVTRSNVSRSDVVEMTAAAQAEPKVMEEAPAPETLQVMLTTSKASGETMSLTVLGENIFIDWGDGEPVAVDGGNPSPIVGGNTSGTLGDDSVKIYGNVTSLDCNSQQITALNVSKATALTYLNCAGNQLTQLGVENNTALTSLVCADNQLSVLDVSHQASLSLFSCMTNKLTVLDVSHNPALEVFYCSENQLTDIDVSSNSALREFDCSDNRLTSVDIAANPALQCFSCDNNQLTRVDVSQQLYLCVFECNNNQLKFSTITGNLNAIEDLWILPQQPISIPASVQAGEMVDLSSEYDIGGTKTVYTWYDANGNVVTPTKSENGVFTFGNEFGGKTMHCAMSNAKFPDFKEDGWIYVGVSDDGEIIGHDGDARLMTTEVKVEKAESTTTTTAPEIDNGLTVTGDEASAVADADYSDDLKVTDNNGEVVPLDELQLIVSNIEKDKKKTVLEAIKHYAKTFHVDENNTALYDISLVDNNKAHVNVKNGKITVCLKYPDNLGRQAEKYTYKLYHQKADGTVEEIPITCKPNGIWFEATDFSPYALAWAESSGSPGTGESNVLTWIAVNLALLSLAFAGAVIYKKKLIAE